MNPILFPNRVARICGIRGLRHNEIPHYHDTLMSSDVNGELVIVEEPMGWNDNARPHDGWFKCSMPGRWKGVIYLHRSNLCLPVDPDPPYIHQVW